VATAVYVVNTQVFENPRVQEVALNILTPVTAVTTIAAATSVAVSAGSAGLLFNFFTLFLSQPFAFFNRRKARRWGTAYNALSKLPIDLALVRLIDTVTNRILQTRVTDRFGRFLFIVGSGSYRLEASKAGYQFPAPSASGKAYDASFANVYHGETIIVSGSVIAPNLPLEPAVNVENLGTLVRHRFGRTFKHAIAVISSIAAIFSAITAPNVLTIGNLFLQTFMLVAIERLALRPKTKKPGAVIDERGHPVRAVLRLFDAQYNKLIESVVTDFGGRYAFLAGPSTYFVTAEAAGYEVARTGTVDFISKEGMSLLSPTIRLVRQSKPVPASQIQK
jgi:hypothetical protein